MVKNKKASTHPSQTMLGLHDSDKSDDTGGNILSSKKAAKEHMQQLQRLQDKDPEFYQFLKDYDKDLLEFNDEDLDEEGETDIEEVESHDAETGLDGEEPQYTGEAVQKPSAKVITTAMVDSWCTEIKDHKLSAIRSALRAFRAACHYGDDDSGETSRLDIVSSSVFNKIMVLVLTEMDKALRELLKFPPSGGKRETVLDLMHSKLWKKYGNLVKLYLGNSLHVLNQMTDEEMISFTLKRIKCSAVFLAAFPVLLRKFIKVALHFWGTGGGGLQVVSFLFLRDVCVRLGTDCLDTCLRGMYKAYVMNCKIKGKYASGSKLQHIQFLGNCVAELCGVDLSSTYQNAFIYIRQLATVLRGTLTEKPNANLSGKNKGKSRKTSTTETGSKSSLSDRIICLYVLSREVDGEYQFMNLRQKMCARTTSNEKYHVEYKFLLCLRVDFSDNFETQIQVKAYLKVYDWQFLCCLELWTGVICAYSSDHDFRLLAYPLTQIIFGVARLVPTARYFPIRLRCARMLNRISASTGSFIPVSLLLLDMLEMKELNNPPVGGVGKAVDLFTRKLVGKPTLKTRGFQEACVNAVIEQLAEHLAQWSYSISFFELSFVPIVRLRSFCKTTNNDRFRRDIRELIRQVEASVEFANAKRGSTELSPNSPSVGSFLQAEKEAGISPLSQFVAELRLRAQQRSDSLAKSSVLVGEKSAIFSRRASGDDEEDDGDATDEDSGDEAGAEVFSSSWLPSPSAGLAKSPQPKQQQEARKKSSRVSGVALEDDVVEDLILSSDDDEAPDGDLLSEDEDHEPDDPDMEAPNKKRKKPSAPTPSRGKGGPRSKRMKRRKSQRA